MPCGSSKPRPLNGNETNPVAIGVRAKGSTSKKKTRHRPFLEDFFCEVCGFIGWERKRGYTHLCPGPQPIKFAIDRLAICNNCEHNKQGVCVLYKKQHPDRNAAVSTGVKKPISRCPIDKWDKKSVFCPRCKRHGMILGKKILCRFCGWKEKRT